LQTFTTVIFHQQIVSGNYQTKYTLQIDDKTDFSDSVQWRAAIVTMCLGLTGS